jgi:integrase
MPSQVTKPGRQRETEAWTEEETRRFLTAIAGHRWEAPLRLAVLYGLRRSELLGLRWSAVDVKKGTVRIERALVEVRGRPEWSAGKNTRSRRTIPIDPATGTPLGNVLRDRTLSTGKVVRAVAGFDATFSAPKAVSVW